jgi:hypothetical protein
MENFIITVLILGVYLIHYVAGLKLYGVLSGLCLLVKVHVCHLFYEVEGQFEGWLDNFYVRGADINAVFLGTSEGSWKLVCRLPFCAYGPCRTSRYATSIS